MCHLESLDHEAIESTDAKSVENGQGTITAFLPSHQHFAARYTFGVGECFLHDEQAAKSNGEHGSQQTTQRCDDEGLCPLDGGPNVHDQQSRYGENNACSQRFTCRCHGLYCVVLEDRYILEHGSQNNHRHHCSGNAG